MKQLRVGDEVLVHIPAEDREIHRQVAKYHGEQMVISKKKVIDRVGHSYVELEGATSDKWNIPLSFIPEWIIKL